jgi:hypothetical protein
VSALAHSPQQIVFLEPWVGAQTSWCSCKAREPMLKKVSGRSPARGKARIHRKADPFSDVHLGSARRFDRLRRHDSDPSIFKDGFDPAKRTFYQVARGPGLVFFNAASTRAFSACSDSSDLRASDGTRHDALLSRIGRAGAQAAFSSPIVAKGSRGDSNDMILWGLQR